MSTNRDAVVYDFQSEALSNKVASFCENYNAEIDRYNRKAKGKVLEGRTLDDFLDYSKIKWSRNLKRSLRNAKSLEFSSERIRRALYRPFVE